MGLINRNSLLGIGMAGIALLLVACEDADRPPEKPLVRAIKNMTLEVRAGTQQRVLTGLTKAEVTSNAAFEVSGRVIQMMVEFGDRVEEGTLLAQLDSEPYVLALQQAQSALVSARAELLDAQRKLAQQRQLIERGFTTRTNFDSAEARQRTAEAAVSSAESQVGLATRNLSKTELRSPFTGLVASKPVAVFEEVSSGQTIYILQSGDTKVEATLPETLVNVIGVGQRVQVRFPPLGGATVSGWIDKVAPLAGDANAYPIEVTLHEAPDGLRAGMSAEIVLEFETRNTGAAFIVPHGAVKARSGAGTQASVFVYDAASETVSEVPVTVVDVRDNTLEIIGDGLSAGDIIAVAGVSFLDNGMRVTLFDGRTFE